MEFTLADFKNQSDRLKQMIDSFMEFKIQPQIREQLYEQIAILGRSHFKFEKGNKADKYKEQTPYYSVEISWGPRRESFTKPDDILISANVFNGVFDTDTEKALRAAISLSDTPFLRLNTGGWENQRVYDILLSAANPEHCVARFKLIMFLVNHGFTPADYVTKEALKKEADLIEDAKK